MNKKTQPITTLERIFEEGVLNIMQALRVFVELTAYWVFDDFGPTILKEFDLDRLDEYRVLLDGLGGQWQIYDYNVIDN